MNDNDTTDGRIARRNVLKAIGASAGLAAMGSKAIAQEFDTLGTTDIVQVATTFSYDDTTDYQTFRADGISPAVVDAETDTLFLSEAATAADESTVRSQSPITNVGGVASLPASTDRDPDTLVPIGVNHFTYRPDAFLGVPDRFRVPDVSVRLDDQRPVVASEGFEATLEPGTERTFDVDTYTVTARAYQVFEDELADAPHVPEEERAVKIERWDEELEITRTIHTRYLTDLSVVNLGNQQ